MKTSDRKNRIQPQKRGKRCSPVGVRIRSGVRAGYNPQVVYGAEGAGLWGGQH